MMSSNFDRLFETIRNLKGHDKPKSAEAQTDNLSELFLIVGLGNPGEEYKNTRHNVGFMAIDKLAEYLNVSLSSHRAKALVGKTNFQGKAVFLVKPLTYMNHSGFAVRQLANYFKIPVQNIMIVYDDVDLPIGTIRLKAKGGSGGHKGMQSIIDHMGTQEIKRLRIGIGRPPGKKQAADYVLKPFRTKELTEIEIALVKTKDAILEYLTNGIESAMTRYNQVEILD